MLALSGNFVQAKSIGDQTDKKPKVSKSEMTGKMGAKLGKIPKMSFHLTVKEHMTLF